MTEQQRRQIEDAFSAIFQVTDMTEFTRKADILRQPPEISKARVVGSSPVSANSHLVPRHRGFGPLLEKKHNHVSMFN